MPRCSQLAWLLLAVLPVCAQPLVGLNSNWKYFKGRSEPPADWNAPSFDDSGWTGGPSPFYYGEASAGGTQLADMRNGYTTVYLRRAFEAASPAEIDRLVIKALVDDGFLAWINGVEVARFNVAAGRPAFDGVAQGTIEPTWVTNALPAPSSYLRAGSNVLAVQLLNRPITSSDIFFNLSLESATDRVAPTLAQITPPAGKVSELRTVTIRFAEAVQGVSAEDLLVNNQPAESVSGAGDTYTFSFAQPAFGPVDLTWAEGHAIADLADPPNLFAATPWSYTLADDIAPAILELLPASGTAVRTLTQAEVRFTEPVLGVRAQDLLINGAPAASIQARGESAFVFSFPALSAGLANFTWSPSHAIADQAGNRFEGNGWSVTVDPSLPNSEVVISEFLASAENAAGLKDEDGELQDWIELHNRGSNPARLAGWSLTDDPEEPGLWIFPDIILAPGARLVVFASGKDRRPAASGAKLHTNFKLSAEGEYLGLYNGDAPRAAMAEFRGDYPVQRDDYSYGLDSSGAWRYFQSPTPGLPNGTSTISGVTPNPKPTAKRGYVEAPFVLNLTNELAGVSIRYTLDGSSPSATVGQLYSGPLRIDKTTVLRAIAYRANYLPSQVVTFSYLFADQVLRQTNNPPGFPVGSTVMAGYPSDYEMDPQIVDDPAYRDSMKAALLALPVISVAIKLDDMFGAANGIYTHPLSRGAQWERPCSVEIMAPGDDDLQVNCGIQIQGNAAREPIKQPKHPFRLTFKGDYGPKSIRYRLFPDSPAEKFDTLILRAEFNYSWLHWNPTQRLRAQRTRDAWMKDTMRAMGGLASHNRYVHLYINGVYWGVYDPSERPDGSFGEAYLGGGKEDYDVVNEGAVVDGTATAYNTLLAFGNLESLTQYNAIKAYLDMPQFIDYMLLHFFVGHEDWGNNKNWYTIRPKDGSRGFMYVPWDGEMILGDPGVNRVSTTDLPSGLHPKLLASAQYRLDFADRAHRHLFNNGALTPAQNVARWMNRAREIELPIIAESARWGDYRRDVHQYQSPPYELYTRDDQWRREQGRLVNTYFPARTATLLSQLRGANLYPSLAAPVFSQFGGSIQPGFKLRLQGAGTIYYTTNAADPKLYGAMEPSPQAAIYQQEVALSSSTRVKARAFSNGIWSALAEAEFSTDSLRTPVRITEIMYNPPGDSLEFIEIQNQGSLPFDVSGYFLEGVDFIFPPGSVLQPGQIALIGSAANPEAFGSRYPGVAVFGRFGGQLLNRGERLAFVAPSGRTAVSVDYRDEWPWPEEADGGGRSLEIVDPFGDPDDPANWQASLALNGSPGKAASRAALPSVVINEVLAKSTHEADWVELFNRGSAPADVSGWVLLEAGNTNHFTLPSGTTLPASSGLVILCDRQPGAFHAPFALDDEGETLILRDSAGQTIHRFTFGPLPQNYSFGYVEAGRWLCLPTPGKSNQAALSSFPDVLVINEWVSNPAPGDSDWIEVYNPSDSSVGLQGLFLGVSNQLFEISAPAFIGPGAHLRLFADENPGPNHLDFKLPSEGGTIVLRNVDGRVIDSVTYGGQPEGLSHGRLPDGSANVVPFPHAPSPGTTNSLSFVIASSLDSDVFELRWHSRAGAAYRVEFSPDLANWTTLTDITADSERTSAKDSSRSGRRYYRVLARP